MDYQEKIRFLFGHLMPTGRAWNFARGAEKISSVIWTDGVGNLFTDGVGNIFVAKPDVFQSTFGKELINVLMYSFDKAYGDAVSLLYQILADNINFDNIDAINWERIYGLKNSELSIEDRREAILQKQSYPNGIEERAHYTFIQEQLQAAGFNVYIYENRFWDGTEYESYSPNNVKLGTFKLGTSTIGTGEALDVTYIANYLNESDDSGVSASGDNLKYTFYIGGDAFPNRANILLSRKTEFRELVLKFKPLHTVGIALIDYI